MLIIIIWTVAIVIAVTFLALCKAAGKQSREEEIWMAQREKELYRWCDDECLHCEQNDWCRFSEVKESKEDEELDKSKGKS